MYSTLDTLLMEMYIYIAIMENTVEAPKKTKIRSAKWFIYPTSGYMSKGNEITIPPVFMEALFTKTNDR
jgi:hypothetical protein